jgi:hypothetical protein
MIPHSNGLMLPSPKNPLLDVFKGCRKTVENGENSTNIRLA